MSRSPLALLLPLLALFVSPAEAVVGPASDGEAYVDRVVMVLARDGARERVCSGVALGPRLVLTAAHCLADVGNMLVAVRTGGHSAPVAVAAVARHPRYDANATRMRRVSVDLGLVETSAPLEDFRFSELGEPPILGTPVILAGFGVTREGGSPSDGRLRTATLGVVAPVSKVTLWMSDSARSGLGACHGDSGGPLFDGEGRVVAVVAWTNGLGGRGCGAITQGPLVAPEREWIEATKARWGL